MMSQTKSMQGDQQSQRFDADMKVGGMLRSHVPGYTGYIPSVKPENLFSRTYGNLSKVVRANQIYNQNYRTKAVFDDYDDDYTALHAYNFDDKRRHEISDLKKSGVPTQMAQITNMVDPNKQITINYDQI